MIGCKQREAKSAFIRCIAEASGILEWQEYKEAQAEVGQSAGKGGDGSYQSGQEQRQCKVFSGKAYICCAIAFCPVARNEHRGVYYVAASSSFDTACTD